MRALVVTLPEKGHYHPLLGPALELERRGAEVAFAAMADIRSELERAGARRVLVPPGAPPPAEALRGRALAEILSRPEALRGWIRSLLVELPGRQVEAMRALVRDFRPDVMAIDPMAYDAAIAAELEGVPWVGWSTSLNPVVPDGMDSELIRTLRALDPERHALFAAHGLSARFRVSDVLSPRGTAVFSTEALVGPPPPGVELVGPSVGGVRQGERLPPGFGEGRPLVYVSFGSQAWYQPRRFERVLEAARRLDVAVLAAMGDLAAELGGAGLPPHVRCVPFADQLDALSRASVAITHGGANSVMEALAAGVPLLVAPLCNDQPHNRHFVERAGAGLGLDMDACSLDELVAALRTLLADGPARAAARRVRDSYAAHSGAAGAAALAWRSSGR
jgi:UDP:flavonoid glycosyltransferase YjiC (YdhE family)